MPKNIELKLRLGDENECVLVYNRARAQRPNDYLQMLDQTDVYYHSQDPNIRMKLRTEVVGCDAEGSHCLVIYDRANEDRARTSSYVLMDVHQWAPGSDNLIEKAFGKPEVTVHKTRQVMIFDNVRVHFDRVTRLGLFVEFEAVLADGMDEQKNGHKPIAALRTAMYLDNAPVEPRGYRELMLKV